MFDGDHMRDRINRAVVALLKIHGPHLEVHEVFLGHDEMHSFYLDTPTLRTHYRSFKAFLTDAYANGVAYHTIGGNTVIWPDEKVKIKVRFNRRDEYGPFKRPGTCPQRPRVNDLSPTGPRVQDSLN